MKCLSRAARLAAFATVAGAAAFAPTAALANTTATTPPHVAGVFHTRIANVHVRSLPRDATGSRVVATLRSVGTPVSVVCYVNSNNKIWYRSLNPNGYVAGRNLAIPHVHGSKIAPGVPACA